MTEQPKLSLNSVCGGVGDETADCSITLIDWEGVDGMTVCSMKENLDLLTSSRRLRRMRFSFSEQNIVVVVELTTIQYYSDPLRLWFSVFTRK